MSDLLILISSCVLSSVITILTVMLVKHLKHQDHKKKVGVLFNQVKKNRPKHYNYLKNIFAKSNIEDIEHKITKLLNLESLFFTEILKSLLNEDSYNVNIIYRSYSELITYTELFFAEGFSDNTKNENFLNNSIINKIKLDLSHSKTKSELNINDIFDKCYTKEALDNIVVSFNNEVNDLESDSFDSFFEDIESFVEIEPEELEEKIEEITNTQLPSDIQNINQEERVLVTKNLADELEKI